MSPDRLTCLVPTYNRPEFLRRLFQFYQKFPLPCSFLVADSSGPGAMAENQSIIQSVRDTLDITFRHFNVDLTTKCCQALQQIQTPYVVLCADDDYLLPPALQHCVEFLETHPDFSVAQGIMAIVNRPGKPPYATAGYSIVEDDAIARCRKMFRFNFTTFYGVNRTANLRENFRITTSGIDCAHSHFFPEILLSQLSVLRGRVKVLPEIYYLHEEHDANFARTPKVTDPNRAAELEQQFRTALASQFEQNGVSRLTAERLIQEWYGLLPDLGLMQSDRFAVRRLRRFLNRTWRQVLNLVVKDGTIYRRSLRAADWSGQEAEWQAAIRLMTNSPKGIPLSEVAIQRAA